MPRPRFVSCPPGQDALMFRTRQESAQRTIIADDATNRRRLASAGDAHRVSLVADRLPGSDLPGPKRCVRHERLQDSSRNFFRRTPRAGSGPRPAGAKGVVYVVNAEVSARSNPIPRSPARAAFPFPKRRRPLERGRPVVTPRSGRPPNGRDAAPATRAPAASIPGRPPGSGC